MADLSSQLPNDEETLCAGWPCVAFGIFLLTRVPDGGTNRSGITEVPSRGAA